MTITLSMLKPVRMAKSVTIPILSEVTGIKRERIRQLDTATAARRKEPWLDEAVLISRALCTDGVLPLIASGDLTRSKLGKDLGHDRTALLAGMRLPLTAACRLARAHGLADPSLLVVDQTHRQLWDVIASNERGAPPGNCPWCMADIYSGEAHRPTCLPTTLFARDEVEPADVLLVPRVAQEEGRPASSPAPGLKRVRLDAGLTQGEMADSIGVHANHYARTERCELPLPVTVAERVAALYRVDVAMIYRKPEGEENMPEHDETGDDA